MQTGKRSRTLRKLSGCLLALGVALGASGAHAQGINIEPRGSEEWSGAVTPYLFLPVTTTGTSTVAGVAADVDLDLGDIFGALRFAGSARAELWRGEFGIIVDGYYVNLNAGTTAILPGAIGGAATVDITVKQAWAAIIPSWRFYQSSYDDDGVQRPYAFDAGVGVRFNSLRQEVSALVDLGPGPGIQTQLGGTETWFEPVISLRGGAQISDSWSLGARAEVGGFGAGGDDFTYNVLFGADYAPWESVSLKLGWQLYGIDFSTTRADGTFAYDVFQTGPYVGGTFRF